MDEICKRAEAMQAQRMATLRRQYPTLLKSSTMLVRPDRSAIAAGRNPAGRPILVPARARGEHSHFVGTTGGGKSKNSEHWIRQDIANGCGVCVLDPHGEHPDSLYRSLLAWLDQGGYLARRTVHLIDPNARTHTVGFNPLTQPDPETDLSVVAGVTLEAFSRAWGGENTATKPTIERVLTATFAALAEMKLTLVEAPMLLDRQDRHRLRARAVAEVTDPYAREELQRLHELSLDERRRHDFDLEVVGPLNRLARFVRPPAIRGMVGQTDRLLDLREAMDAGHVILCNLSGGARVYEADADLLGRLVTRMLFFHAKRRRAPGRPFYVYLDECHRYLSGDLENILAEARKYGVAAVLSHQWLEQLRTIGDNMLAAVLNATNVKVVFRVKDAKEAEELAASVIPLNLEIPVHALVKPTVIGHRRIRLGNESNSEQKARSHAESTSYGESETRTNSYGESDATTDATSETLSESDSWSETEGQSHSESLGHSQGTVGTDMLTPSTGFFDAPQLVGMSRATSAGSSASVSTGTSSQVGRSAASGRATSTSRAKTHSSSWSESQSHGTSRVNSTGISDTRGTGRSHGSAEALEPVFANLPSAVHSKENVLYMAAQTLRHLQTGHAFISFMGASGMVSELLTVPLISEHKLSSEAFAALRERILMQSTAALPTAAALAAIAQRVPLMLEANSADVEPASFRVKAGSAVHGAARTPPAAPGRVRARSSSKRKPSVDRGAPAQRKGDGGV